MAEDKQAKFVVDGGEPVKKRRQMERPVPDAPPCSVCNHPVHSKYVACLVCGCEGLPK